MKIYTKTGDKGETSFFGGKRVAKNALRIEAYGTVDELNSQLGVILSLKPSERIRGILLSLQNMLFVLGADLASPEASPSEKTPRIVLSNVEELERWIDDLDGVLPPLRSFILPGGTRIGAEMHVARTTCRRAERIAVNLSKQEKIAEPIIMFLNRLSDLLFVMARFANREGGSEETTWNSSA